ncbi:hypothetical protein R1flu_026273 [Riccia fluitans]|uniref:Uncharacterized protein n=1 Tax=Riccia fluitans TaxID=41844 RepID=A0ABD1XFH5_9MARC
MLLHQVFADDTGINLTANENNSGISPPPFTSSRIFPKPGSPSANPSSCLRDPKKELVTWERITQAKRYCGLGWNPLKGIGPSHEMLNENPDGAGMEWEVTARSFILQNLRQNPTNVNIDNCRPRKG